MTTVIPDFTLTECSSTSSQLMIIELDKLYRDFKNILCTPHRILFYQIILITEGSSNIWADFSQYQFNPKSLFAFSKGQIEIFNIDKKINGYAVLFSEEFINKYPGDLGWINSLKLFNQSSDKQFIIKLQDREYDEILVLLKQMNAELKSQDNFARDEILANLLKTFLIVSERIKRTRIRNISATNGNWEYLIEFKNKLEEHYHSSKSVNFYADLLCVTPKKLNQVIIGFWGKSAKQIIEERVLLESKRLLMHTDKTIKEIGSTLGFSDPTNFNKFFKKYAKVTPFNFRTSQKNKVFVQ
jgi:AraC family transcriptional regulator, transcriptional activator of pobA